MVSPTSMQSNGQLWSSNGMYVMTFNKALGEHFICLCVRWDATSCVCVCVRGLRPCWFAAMHAWGV